MSECSSESSDASSNSVKEIEINFDVTEYVPSYDNVLFTHIENLLPHVESWSSELVEDFMSHVAASPFTSLLTINHEDSIVSNSGLQSDVLSDASDLLGYFTIVVMHDQSPSLRFLRAFLSPALRSSLLKVPLVTVVACRPAAVSHLLGVQLYTETLHSLLNAMQHERELQSCPVLFLIRCVAVEDPEEYADVMVDGYNGFIPCCEEEGVLLRLAKTDATSSPSAAIAKRSGKKKRKLEDSQGRSGIGGSVTGPHVALPKPPVPLDTVTPPAPAQILVPVVVSGPAALQSILHDLQHFDSWFTTPAAAKLGVVY